MLENSSKPSEFELPTFEFDPRKSAQIKEDPNRGIDFIEAQQLWADPERLEISLPFTAESRRALVARIGTKLWTAIFTHRGKNIRIISVRRAHQKEEALYESKS
jgi:uncharacterized protein